jgi:hypothetical protein
MILDVQQAVDNILQHLVLCLSRQTRGSTRTSTADHPGGRAQPPAARRSTNPVV